MSLRVDSVVDAVEQVAIDVVAQRVEHVRGRLRDRLLVGDAPDDGLIAERSHALVRTRGKTEHRNERAPHSFLPRS
jgi:hypothetical protein